MSCAAAVDRCEGVSCIACVFAKLPLPTMVVLPSTIAEVARWRWYGPPTIAACGLVLPLVLR